MKASRLRDAITRFSSESLNAVASVMLAGAFASQLPAKPIPVKPEVAEQLKLFTDNYMTRGFTRFSCGFARWGIKGVTKQEYHPTINLVCNVLRQLPRQESQKLLHKIGESITDNVITAHEQTTIRQIITDNNITVPCPEFREALTAIPNTKKDNPTQIDPKRIAAKQLAEVIAGCKDPIATLRGYIGLNKEEPATAQPAHPHESEPNR